MRQTCQEQPNRIPTTLSLERETRYFVPLPPSGLASNLKARRARVQPEPKDLVRGLAHSGSHVRNVVCDLSDHLVRMCLLAERVVRAIQQPQHVLANHPASAWARSRCMLKLGTWCFWWCFWTSNFQRSFCSHLAIAGARRRAHIVK